MDTSKQRTNIEKGALDTTRNQVIQIVAHLISGSVIDMFFFGFKCARTVVF